MTRTTLEKIVNRPWPKWAGPALFAVLAFAMFADVLVAGGGRVVGSPEADLPLHFAASRAFGFGELARGNFPLWNPQMFAGYPYFGGFQPGLLYPLNWLFVILPLGIAINFSLALHVCLAGWFTYLWLRRDNGDLPAAVGGVAFMFCARFFMHVYAGHLPHVCLVPWLPLLLMSIDGLTRDGRFAWSLLAAWASAMMLLAGYPQMLYFALVLLPVYAGAKIAGSAFKLRAIGGLAAAAVLAIGLCTAQIWTGVEAAGESVRQGGTTYEFASSFSFPPENLLTIVAPGALGELREAIGPRDIAYVGEGYLWEMSTYLGAAAIVLAIVGVISGGRGAILPAAMVVLAAILGLGANTPVHRLLFDWLPGFSTFRGSSKFLYIASLFLVQLAAMGLRSIAVAPRRIWPAIVAVICAATLFIAGAAIRASNETGASSWFGTMLQAIAKRGIERRDYYFDKSNFELDGPVRAIARHCAHSLWIAGLWTSAAAAAIALARWRTSAAIVALALLVAAESFSFARQARPTSPLVTDLPPPWKEALTAMDDSQRFVRNLSTYDYRGALASKRDAWGYDPGMLRRYAEFIAASQGFKPEDAAYGIVFNREPPTAFRLARVTTILEGRDPAGPLAFKTQLPPLPRAVLLSNAIVISADASQAETETRDSIFRVLASAQFNPANTVLLEKAPSIAPSHSFAPVPVEMEEIDSDTRRLRVRAPANGIVLVTEAYSRHWHASGRRGSTTEAYDVLPGDWAFIAIPVTAGEHEITLECSPHGWILGRWISLAALSIFLFSVGLFWRKSRTGLK